MFSQQTWRLTFTSPLYLTHTVQSIRHHVREPPVQIHRCQTSLKTFFCMHQFGQLLVHLLGHPTNVKVACAEITNTTILTPGGNKTCCSPFYISKSIKLSTSKEIVAQPDISILNYLISTCLKNNSLK